MKNFLIVCLLVCCVVPVFGQNGVRYTVQNQTGGLSGSTYPVTTAVQFSTLALTLTYADASTFTENLLGTLAPSASKNSASYLLVDPTHGAITGASISGLYSTLNWQESPTFLGPKTSVTVSNPFTASVTGGTLKFAFIDGTDTTSGISYHAGNLSSGPVTITATPEPGAWAFGLACVAVGAGTRLQRRRVRA